MQQASLCPSCRQPCAVHQFKAADGRAIALDLCFACQGIWFDPQENTRLAPQAVIELFELLHTHAGDAHLPLSTHLRCPHCRKALVKGFDVAQGGRYITYRCAARHGRFSTFGAFMVEKGFVRHLSTLEIEALAKRVGTIACTSCGGTVDIRNDHACPWCRSALALLDHQAVERALQRHQAAAQSQQDTRNPEALANALVALERENARQAREKQKERIQGSGGGAAEGFDLLAAGIDLVWTLLRRSV